MRFGFRNIAAAGAMGVAAMGLVGMGAHAVFTQDTTSTQNIYAGSMNVTISSPGASGNGSQAIQLANFGYTNSSFTTGDQTVTITNQSNIPVTEVVATPGMNFAAGAANAAFAAQTFLCEISSGQVIYNGPASAAPSQSIAGTLGVGATDSYSVNYYAGPSTVEGCGALSVGASAVAGTNPAAAALTDAAQGGVISPSMKVTYNG